jgi:copper chaperone CopZ
MMGSSVKFYGNQTWAPAFRHAVSALSVAPARPRNLGQGALVWQNSCFYALRRKSGGHGRFVRAISTDFSVQKLEQEEAKLEAADTLTTPAVLTVQGMKCGGCSAAVKRILLQQPGVNSAAVNLLTETAVIQLSTKFDTSTAIKQAAKVLTSKGFPSSPRTAGTDDELAAGAAGINARRTQDLKES